MTEPLSTRLRAGVECAPWVIEEVQKLEARAQPAQAVQAVLIVQDGEICYKSKSDDQSYGMWCPVTPDADHGLANGTELYAEPQQAEAVPPGYVLVPIDVLEAASESLGSFVSDNGWTDLDMQAMDNLDAILAQQKGGV